MQLIHTSIACTRPYVRVIRIKNKETYLCGSVARVEVCTASWRRPYELRASTCKWFSFYSNITSAYY